MSGTLRFDAFTDPPAVREFVDNRKEIDELFMVLDEELKMVCQMNPSSVTIRGPYLDVFGNVAHTYFEINADTTLSAHDVLLQSLFAPTVTGSPLREAFNVIARNERSPRGYYGGVLCWLRRRGQAIRLDSAIAIRTVYVEPDGRISLPVGATIVRHSAPRAEVAETASKASGLLAALQGDPATAAASSDVGRLLDDAQVQARLQGRRDRMSEFWLFGQARLGKRPGDKNALIVDFDDDWTCMLAYLMSDCGIHSRIVSWRDLGAEAELGQWLADVGGVDILVLGPGPGAPTDVSDPRIRMANQLACIVGIHRIPTLAVCLSHQCLSRRFGLKLARLSVPAQGTVRTVSIAGARYSLAFYNSYAAYYRPSDLPILLPKDAEVWFDSKTGEVFGFAAPGIVSVQFHLESAISRDGAAVARILLSSLLR